MKEHRQLLEQEVEKVINEVKHVEQVYIYLGFIGALKIELQHSKDGMLSAEKIVECFRSGVEVHREVNERLNRSSIR